MILFLLEHELHEFDEFMTDEERKQEIAGFLRQKMVAENKRFSEFVDNMNGRGYYGGSIFVQFTDGTTDEYLLRPEDWQDVINFAQALCAKRTKECQNKLKDYE